VQVLLFLKQFNVGGHTPLDGFPLKEHFESQLTAHFCVLQLIVIMSSVLGKRAFTTIFYTAIHRVLTKFQQ
jgi:hypothetical protein